MEKSLEIERLGAQIRRNMQTPPGAPQAHFHRRARPEYGSRRAVDNWRPKIDRIGNLNYPEEAKTRRIYGSLQLTVAIKVDATWKASKSTALPDSGSWTRPPSAPRLAAPFERFPDNVRVDTDIQHITPHLVLHPR